MNTLPSRKGSFARILCNVLESLDFIADTSEDVPKVTDAGLVLHRPKIQDRQIMLGEVLRRHRRPPINGAGMNRRRSTSAVSYIESLESISPPDRREVLLTPINTTCQPMTARQQSFLR
jgi:hypothetical protein